MKTFLSFNIKKSLLLYFFTTPALAMQPYLLMLPKDVIDHMIIKLSIELTTKKKALANFKAFFSKGGIQCCTRFNSKFRSVIYKKFMNKFIEKFSNELDPGTQLIPEIITQKINLAIDLVSSHAIKWLFSQCDMPNHENDIPDLKKRIDAYLFTRTVSAGHARFLMCLFNEFYKGQLVDLRLDPIIYHLRWPLPGEEVTCLTMLIKAVHYISQAYPLNQSLDEENTELVRDKHLALLDIIKLHLMLCCDPRVGPDLGHQALDIQWVWNGKKKIFPKNEYRDTLLAIEQKIKNLIDPANGAIGNIQPQEEALHPPQ